MADAPPRARIVIPAYTNPGLRDCLDALRGLPDPVAFEVVVVLNGATLEVRRIAAGFAGWATILEVPVNLGVGGGFNHGFAGSGCDYLVELQDDAVVEAGWLDALVRCADREPDAGAVGSLSLDREGRVRDPGHIAWRDGTTSPALVGGSRDPDRYTEVRAVDYHGSSGLLIRRRAWESVSGIDPGYYPAYYGDVDLCFRLRERGWRVLVEPRSRLRHAGAQSSTSGFRRFVAARLRQRFVDRHGDALALHGAPSSHPRAVADEIARAARAPARPEPEPPTPAELAALQERLRFDPLQVLRRERDVWADFARATSGQLDQAGARLDQVAADARRHAAALEAQAAWLRGEVARRDADLVAARGWIDTLDARCGSLADALAARDAQLAGREADLAAVRGELADALARLGAALRSLDAMSRSRSWRWTRLLREGRPRRGRAGPAGGPPGSAG